MNDKIERYFIGHYIRGEDYSAIGIVEEVEGKTAAIWSIYRSSFKHKGFKREYV